MPRMLYGESYGGIASQELARDSARDQRYFQSLAARRQVEQMMAAQREAALARRQRAQEFAASMEMQRAGLDRQDRTLSTNRSDRLFDSMLENRRFYDKLAADTADDRSRRSDVEFRSASDAVLEGAIRGTEVDKLFPSLSDIHRNRLKALSRSVEEFEGEESSASQSAADSANAQIKLATMAKREGLMGDIDELDASLRTSLKGPNMPKWLPFGDGTEGTLKREAAAKMLALTQGKPMHEVNLTSAELQALLQSILKNRNISDNATFDDTTQSFVPSVRRRGMPPITNGGAPGPGMPAGAPPIQPTIQPNISQPNIASGQMFNNEGAARAAGFGAGSIIYLFDPGTGKYRRARLK